jgi:hypothetical protein
MARVLQTIHKKPLNIIRTRKYRPLALPLELVLYGSSMYFETMYSDIILFLMTVIGGPMKNYKRGCEMRRTSRDGQLG